MDTTRRVAARDCLKRTTKKIAPPPPTNPHESGDACDACIPSLARILMLASLWQRRCSSLYRAPLRAALYIWYRRVQLAS
jgi:hypothetical protein